MKNKTQKLYPITPEELGGLLFYIHEHMEHKDGTDYIIYYEKDIIKLLTKLGFPKPKWGISVNINKFNLKKKRDSMLVKHDKITKSHY